MANVKEYTDVPTQIAKLRGREMVVDEGEAQQWLSHVNYYRLSGYWYIYRRKAADGTRLDEFEPGTTFHDITRLYEFDRKLRSLTHEALGRVEIALRRGLSDHLGAIDPLAYLLPEFFRSEFDHADWVATAADRVSRAARSSRFIRHQKAAYDGIPIWVLSEVLDFRDLSLLYAGLEAPDQWNVARSLGINIDLQAIKKPKDREKADTKHPLAAWIHQLSIVRNFSAHHARLWNDKTFVPASTIALRTIPQLESLPHAGRAGNQSSRLYGALLVIAHILSTISPGSSWASRVRQLIVGELEEIPMRSAQEMGFPEDWKQQELWS